MTEQALSEEEPHFCTNCGSPINSTDKFCTNCGALIQRGSATAAAEVASTPEQVVSEAEQAANTAQPTASAAVAVKKPRKKAAAIAVAIVGTLVITSVLIILGLMQLNVLANPFAKARPVTFAIKAPHYNEKTDSKIPLHITGKTVSGKVISQHVYVSPKAPVVHLDPGVYKVQVEASPLMSSGEFYKTPAPLTVDTRSANAVISTAQPAKPQLTFEVKPANEVTQQDIALAEKFAKKTGLSDNQLKAAKLGISIHRIAQLYREIIKHANNIDFTNADQGIGADDPRVKLGYSLEDINGDAIPDLLMVEYHSYMDAVVPIWQRIKPFIANPSTMSVQETSYSLIDGIPGNAEFHVMGSKSGNGLYRTFAGGGFDNPSSYDHFTFGDVSKLSSEHFVGIKNLRDIGNPDTEELHFYELTDDSPIAQFEKEATQAETSDTHNSEKDDSEPSKSTADSKSTDKKDSNSESNSGKKKAQSSQSEAKKKSDSHYSQNQKKSKASNEEKKKSSDKKSR